MIRITSIHQALSLRGTIPDLAVIRSLQFMGDGYNPEEHGQIIVIQKGDDITQIEEVGKDGLFIDDVPTFEFDDIAQSSSALLIQNLPQQHPITSQLMPAQIALATTDPD